MRLDAARAPLRASFERPVDRRMECFWQTCHRATSACNRDITLDELCKIYKGQKRAKCESYLPALNATFKAYKIESCLRKAHFLAQVGHESAS